MENDFNFVSQTATGGDIELFFDPKGNDTINVMGDNWAMSHIMCAVGMFPSVSQARKNGWNKPIPDGFSEMTVGKKRIKITILNKVE